MRLAAVFCCLVAVASGQESAFTRAQRALEEARAAEKVGLAALAARQKTLRAAEETLRNDAERQMRIAAKHVAGLEAIEDAIAKAYGERLDIAAGSGALRTEAALLRKWFDAITSGTTSIPVALRLAGIQLRALGKSGVIAPRRTSFATAHELRNYLADVKARLTVAATRETEQKDALDRELATLKLRWSTAMRRVGGPVHVRATAMDAWTAAAAHAAEARRILADRERVVASRHSALMAVARRHSPPILARVSIQAPHRVHEASWFVDGKREDARAVDALMRAVNAKIAIVASDIITIEAKLPPLHAQRLALARAMHEDGKALDAAAQQYRSAVINKEIAKIVVDVTVLLVTSAATGGVGALATQSNRLAKQLEKRLAGTTALADAAGEVVPNRMYHKLLQSGAHLTSDPLKRMNRTQLTGKFMIDEYVNAAEALARREGRNVVKASRRAQLEAHRVLDRVDMQLPLREQQKRLTELLEVAKKKARMPKIQRVAGSGARAVYHVATQPRNRALRAKDLDKETKNILLGDALAAGVNAVGGVALRQRLVAPDVSGLKALRATLGKPNLLGALRGQAVGMVAGAAGTAAKVYFTRRFQAQANAAIPKFWARFAELAARQEIYYRAVLENRALKDGLRRARRSHALLERDLVTLQHPRTIRRTTSGYVWNPAAPVTARLEFSNVLGRAPVVMLGGIAMAVTPDGGKAPTAIWFAKLPAKRLAPGTHRLAVSLGKGAAWPSLDAKPETRAYTLHAMLNVWRDWEKGADENHAIRVDFEIATAIAAIRSYDNALKEHGDRGAVLYGSGKPGATGWGGMEKSVREAHRRVGAKEVGDPHGHWWMAGGRLGLSNGGTHAVGGPARRFAEHLLRRAAAGKTMSDKERAFQRRAINALYGWYRTRDAWYKAARAWMDRGAMFARIDADTNRKAWAENKAARDKIEALLREMNAALPEFKE